MRLFDEVSEVYWFLRRVWGWHPQRGFVFVGTRHCRTGRWDEHPIDLAKPLELKKLLTEYPAERSDIYFCPNRFRRAARRTQYALPSPFAWSDVDYGNVHTCCPKPNLIWQTSPGRRQALWILDAPEEPGRAEDYSRALTAAAGGDSNGWSITKYLRVPGTYNHKPDYNRPQVKLITENWRPRSTRPPLPRRPPKPFLTTSLADLAADESVLGDFSVTFEKFRHRLQHRVRCLIRSRTLVWEPDRSKCVYEIVCDLHRVGASLPEIATILRDNVYFVSKYGDSRSALRREITRILEKSRS